MQTFPPLPTLPPNRHDMLRFDWEPIDDADVLAVHGYVTPLEPGDAAPAPGQWEKIAFVLDKGAVVVSIDFDTDQLFVEGLPFDPSATGWEPIPELARIVGRPMGWAWEMRNHRGYLDGFVLGFGDRGEPGLVLDPRLMLVSIASHIQILWVGPGVQD